MEFATIDGTIVKVFASGQGLGNGLDSSSGVEQNCGSVENQGRRRADSLFSRNRGARAGFGAIS